MKSFLMMILAAILMVFPLTNPALAAKIDMGKVTCAQFIELDAEETTYFYFWLDGYFSAKSGDLVLDGSTAESDINEILRQCEANKGATVMKILGQ